MEEGKTTQSGRRWRRALIVIAGCALVAIALVAFWPAEREPQYNGKKLSEWLVAYEFSLSGTLFLNDSHAEARDAVYHIGTNALPWLLRWLQNDVRKTPKWKTSLFVLACKLHLKGTHVVVAPDGTKGYWADQSPVASLIKNRERTLADCARDHGFKLLGEQAVDALPELVRLAHGTNATVSSRAKYALYTVLDLVPQWQKMLTNSDASVRFRGVHAFSSFDSLTRAFPLDIPGIVPSLVERLDDPDLRVRQEATNALRKIAPKSLTTGAKDF